MRTFATKDQAADSIFMDVTPCQGQAIAAVLNLADSGILCVEGDANYYKEYFKDVAPNVLRNLSREGREYLVIFMFFVVFFLKYLGRLYFG